MSETINPMGNMAVPVMAGDTVFSLVNRTLMRAANQLGDITPLVYQAYYARHPEAQEQFRFHDPIDPARLEGSMVEQTLYCLMRWFEAPEEVRLILDATIPHHICTLHVSETLFNDLLSVVCDVISSTIPPDEHAERANWRALHTALLDLCRQTVTDYCPHAVRQTI